VDDNDNDDVLPFIGAINGTFVTTFDAVTTVAVVAVVDGGAPTAGAEGRGGCDMVFFLSFSSSESSDDVSLSSSDDDDESDSSSFFAASLTMTKSACHSRAYTGPIFLPTSFLSGKNSRWNGLYDTLTHKIQTRVQ
jgi:hypothetical protein